MHEANLVELVFYLVDLFGVHFNFPCQVLGSDDLNDHARYRPQHANKPVEVIVHLVCVLHGTQFLLKRRLGLCQVSCEGVHVAEDCKAALGEAWEVAPRANVQISGLQSFAPKHLDRFELVSYAAQVEADNEGARVTVEVICIQYRRLSGFLLDLHS